MFWSFEFFLKFSWRRVNWRVPLWLNCSEVCGWITTPIAWPNFTQAPDPSTPFLIKYSFGKEPKSIPLELPSLIHDHSLISNQVPHLLSSPGRWCLSSVGILSGCPGRNTPRCLCSLARDWPLGWTRLPGSNELSPTAGLHCELPVS